MKKCQCGHHSVDSKKTCRECGQPFPELSADGQSIEVKPNVKKSLEKKLKSDYDKKEYQKSKAIPGPPEGSVVTSLMNKD